MMNQTNATIHQMLRLTVDNWDILKIRAPAHIGAMNPAFVKRKGPFADPNREQIFYIFHLLIYIVDPYLLPPFLGI
jgi:hypothetical protein